MAGGVRRACTALVVAIAVLGVGGPPAGALEPSLTDLGEGFTPVGINSSGVVVGTRTAGPSAGPATWAGGTFTSLMLPGGATAGTVTDIADDGRVVGSAFFNPGPPTGLYSLGVVWAGGAPTTLPGPISGASTFQSTNAEAISPNGVHIGGSAVFCQPNPALPPPNNLSCPGVAARSTGGAWSSLLSAPLVNWSGSVIDINDSGIAIGGQGTVFVPSEWGVFAGGSFTQLSTSTPRVTPLRIFNDGTVIGVGPGPAPVRRGPGETAFTPIPCGSGIYDGNNAGDVLTLVGTKPAVWHGGVCHLLENVLPADANGWTSISVLKISGQGHILGRAVPPGGGAQRTVVIVPRYPGAQLSGRVTGIDGHAAEPGLTVTAVGKTTASATTAADGSYSMTVEAGTYTVTPSGKGGEFAPVSRTVVVDAAPVTADFQVGFRVAGAVTESSCTEKACTKKGAQGVTVAATDKAGGKGGKATSAKDGTWSLLLGPGDYDLEPSTTDDEAFDPESRTLALHSRTDGQNFNRCADEPEGASASASARSSQAAKPICDADKVDWHMPERLSDATAGVWRKSSKGLPTRDFVNPTSWLVELFVTTKAGKKLSCTAVVRYRWTIDAKKLPKGAKVVTAPKPGCETTMRVSQEGKYALTAVREEKVKGKWRKAGSSFRKTVLVKDWLVVAMGDSNGSGEGNPPFYFERCNRSKDSYQFQTAVRLEDADPHTSVTLIHTSCSGASVAHLIDQQYAGTRPEKTKLDEQLDQIGFLLSPIKALGDKHREPRRPDAAIISIGVNNLGFGPLLKYCILLGERPCQDVPTDVKPDGIGGVKEFTAGKRATMARRLNTLQSKLPGHFRSLRRALRRDVRPKDSGLGDLPSSHVFMSHYPNFSRGADGTACDTRAAPQSVDGGLVLSGYVAAWDPSTWKWIGDAGIRLNKEVSAAASIYGWRISRIDDKLFEKRGYCAPDSLFVGVVEGAYKSDVAGPFHPRREAHDFNAAGTFRSLCPQLYRDPACKTTPK